MVQCDSHNQGFPRSWGDVRMVILGDSRVGNLSFKEIPVEDRPKLRARSFKAAHLHKLLPKVGSEITHYKPDLLVLSVGYCDLTHAGSQYFEEQQHQHRVRKISYDFNVEIAADEIFRQWHSWLAQYSCKVLVALTFPLDFQEYNVRKLKHCSECQGLYSDGDEREILSNKIEKWGDLLKEKGVPVMYLDAVLKKKNPDYMMTDSIIEEKERALIDGLRVSEEFGENFYTVIREVVEEFWPNFISEEETSQEYESYHSSPPSTSEEPTDEANGEEAAVVLPPPKKTKRSFRF